MSRPDKFPSKVTIHMVSSLDGYAASRDNNVEWMNTKDRYEQGIILTAEEINAYLASIDCYIMGAKTYEHALELGWPYGDTPVQVVTRQPRSSGKDSVSFHSGDLTEWVNQVLKTRYRNIWLVGGPDLVRQFIRLNLADEIIYTIVPILIGGGYPFFDAIAKVQPLHLKDQRAYANGMVELTYEILKTDG